MTKTMLWQAGLGFVFLLAAGCTKPAKADVNCTGSAAGMSCVISETEGDSKLKVCWDIKAVCKNGTIVNAKGNCGEVAGGGKTTVEVPNAKLENEAKCDTSVNTTLENLVLTPL
ncbi:MAG TPA: hypothetical protein VGL81_08705 [Polyangiaceae bacterium]